MRYLQALYRQHNRFEAEHVYGAAFVRAKIDELDLATFLARVGHRALVGRTRPMGTCRANRAT